VLEFRILGPLEARDGDEAVPLGGPKQRALLAILLLHANEPVSVDRLVDELWGEQPPGTAAHSVEVYVSQLRKALGPGRIVTQRPGYRLELGQDELDLHAFERLLADGRAALADGDAASAAGTLREALGLWRGAPLADFAFEGFAQQAIGRLEELHLAAVEDRVEADLALGRHAQLVPELEELVRRHPLVERLRGQLMLALYRAGRQAEALEAYAATRAALVEELGIEPSPALQKLERAILNQDAELDAPTGGRPRSAAPVGAAERSILLVGSDDAELEPLIALASPLARSRRPHELVLVRLLVPGEALREAASQLEARRAALVNEGVPTRAAAFTSDDPGADVVRLAAQQDVDLVLLDARGTTFPAHVTTVLEEAPSDVALLVGGDPGTRDEGAIVVPFGGGEHDWSALELGAWLAAGRGALLEVCGAIADGALGRRDASRLLATASLVVQQLAGVAAQPVLTDATVGGVVEAASNALALVLGLSDRWRTEGLGEARAAIAAAVAAPCLAVRRGLRPGGLSPPESATRFTWSLAAPQSS
jgi:DNA-binding SARP family transcriptional activator